MRRLRIGWRLTWRLRRVGWRQAEVSDLEKKRGRRGPKAGQEVNFEGANAIVEGRTPRH